MTCTTEPTITHDNSTKQFPELSYLDDERRPYTVMMNTRRKRWTRNTCYATYTNSRLWRIYYKIRQPHDDYELTSKQCWKSYETPRRWHITMKMMNTSTTSFSTSCYRIKFKQVLSPIVNHTQQFSPGWMTVHGPTGHGIQLEKEIPSQE